MHKRTDLWIYPGSFSVTAMPPKIIVFQFKSCNKVYIPNEVNITKLTWSF